MIMRPRSNKGFYRSLSALGLLVASLSACSGDGQSVGQHVRDPIAVAGPQQESAPFSSEEPPALEPSEVHGATSAATRLVYSHVTATVRGGSVVTRVTDVVSNDGPGPVDFSYTFPLPGDATVSELAYFSNGKRVRAASQEKSEATAAFERAKARGESATLSENTGNSRFSVAMSPLAAGESRRVELEYVQGLESFGAERSFTFPAAHSQRRGDPTLDFEVNIEGDSELSNVSSLNHPDARIVKLSAKSERVLLSRTASPLGQDLVVRWTERAEPLELSLRAVAAKPPEPGKPQEPGFAQMDFSFNADTFAREEPARDFVFVVDTSLSMAGEALEQAKELVDRSLERLTERDRLALVEFDDQLASWSELVPATAQVKDRARSELRPKRASGFSNVEAAIDRARELTSHSKNPTLVLVTDGQSTVGEKPDELAPASKASDFEGTRVFVALVNYPSRQPQLEQLFPHLTLRFLAGGDAGHELTRSLSQLVSAPVLENVTVSVDGLASDDRYGKLPDRLALGDRIHVLGRTTSPTLKASVSGTLHGHPVHFEKSVVLSERETDRVNVPREWARSKLGSLEERYAHEHDPALQSEAIELAKQFGLVSSFTSLVATDGLSPDRIAPGDPELRIRAPRNTGAVSAMLPWGEEVHCAWHEAEGVWLGRFLVPRSTHDGLYKVSVFTTNQGRTSGRGTLFLRVDSRAPQYQLRATQSDTSLELTALPDADVFDRNGDSIRLDLVDVKSVSTQLDGHSYRLERAEAGTWHVSVPPLGNGEHRATLVATDYAQNSSRSLAKVTIGKGHSTRVAMLKPNDSATAGEAALPVAAATLPNEQHVPDTRCWFEEGPRRAALQVGAETVELFDGFLRVAGHDLTPCNGLPSARPIAITAHEAGFVVAFRDGSRSYYHGGAFERAPKPSAREARALQPRSRPSSTSKVSAGELPSAHVSALATFQGKLIVGTFDGGAFTVDSSQHFAALDGAPRFVNALLAEPDRLWVASATGLFVLENGAFREVPLSRAASHVNGLTRAKDGTLWLATSDGLLGLTGGEWRQLDERQGLPSHIVYAVTESSDGALWAGTAGGVARIAKEGVKTFSVDDGALPHRWVTALLADGAGVWVGTYQGGITHLDASGAHAVSGTQALWLNPNGLVQTGKRIYASSMGGGLFAFEPDAAAESNNAVRLGPLPSDDVTAVSSFAGALWVGTRSGLARIPD